MARSTNLDRVAQSLAVAGSLGRSLAGYQRESHAAVTVEQAFQLPKVDRHTGRAERQASGVVGRHLQLLLQSGRRRGCANLVEQAGYQVHIATPLAGDKEDRPLCCGRTYFSNGLIAKARQEAQRMLAALAEHIAAGRTIIGLEPSCILSLRDEYLKLKLGEAAQQLAEKVLLLEEVHRPRQTANRWPLQFQAIPGVSKLLLHGHCHQKAVGAIKSVHKLLKQLPDLTIRADRIVVCGMAGNFGVEANTTSMASDGRTSLFPALRAEPRGIVGQ